MEKPVERYAMHTIVLRSFSAACLAALLLAAPAYAEPEPQAEEEQDPDALLVEGLLGTRYAGELPIEGWTDYGGGLVSPPIYVHLYQREDGSSLVLTSKLSNREFEVIDAMVVSKPWKGYAISIGCTKGDDFTLRFIGDARGPDESEWWTEVRRAWEIAVPPKPKSEEEAEEASAETEAEPAPAPEAATPPPRPGQITKTDTRGVKCTNPNW